MWVAGLGGNQTNASISQDSQAYCPTGKEGKQEKQIRSKTHKAQKLGTWQKYTFKKYTSQKYTLTNFLAYQSKS